MLIGKYHLYLEMTVLRIIMNFTTNVFTYVPDIIFISQNDCETQIILFLYRVHVLNV